MQRLALQSWRIELLNDWLQRHFSAKTSNPSEVNAQFLGDSGQYACKLLREMTRADVGVTLYQKDYGENQCLLRVVAEDSDDPGVMASLDNRQGSMDDIREKHQGGAFEYSYCYRSIHENRFLYEPIMNPKNPATQSYPEYRRPQSVMIMPLHMEQRLMGAIEIKGSQANHFRWSHRLRLQQVASVLAPYFYRQQLLYSLSKISSLVLKHRFSDMEVFGAHTAEKAFFSDACRELCQI
jgi:hypothetical protein